MKRIAFLVSCVSFFGFLVSSCDVVENPLPKSYGSLSEKDALALDSMEDKTGIPPVVQKVLLEDYTGHYCGNCPGASVEAKNLQTKYGEKLVVMAVHAGYFAKVRADGKFTYNFSTPAGEEWNTAFGIQANPNGTVNRTPRPGVTAVYQGVANWSASVAAHMATAPKVGLNITAAYKPDSRTVQIKVRSQYLTGLTGNYNLAVFITEDSVVKMQKNYGAAAGGDPAYDVGDIPDYVHPHVLRAAADGTWGRLSKANPGANDVIENYYLVTLEPEWREKKISIVAFLFNEQTREVIQVEEKHLFDH